MAEELLVRIVADFYHPGKGERFEMFLEDIFGIDLNLSNFCLCQTLDN